MTPIGKTAALAPPKGRVITFYSYKGGTGRSMALANVAWMLALRGERVLVVDWDLEAPGVHRYFHPFLEDKDLVSTEGLLDFVIKLAGQAAAAPEPEALSDDDVDVMQYTTMLRWPAGHQIRWENFGPQARLDLLTAGRQGPSYSAKLNGFNWIDFYEKLGGRRLLTMARNQMSRLYDYVLIDSRTGVSDTSGICTVEMPDTLVVCFTLNDQSIIGASGVAESVLAQRKRLSEMSAPSEALTPALPFRIFPVPMRVEIVGERTKREAALVLAKQRFSGLIEHLPTDRRSRYWGSVEMPYFPFYAFEEIPAVFGDPANQDISLSTPVRCLTQFLTDENLAPPVLLHKEEAEAERLRKLMLGWYLRRGASSAIASVALTDSVYDRMDADSKERMKQLMLRLVQVNLNGPPAPVTLPLEDLEEPLQKIAPDLIVAGIVTGSLSSLFLSDRRIAESWNLLQLWVLEDQTFLLWRQNLGAAARSWRQAGKDQSALLRGRLLEEALAFLTQRRSDLNQAEIDFITQSDSNRGAGGKIRLALREGKYTWRSVGVLSSKAGLTESETLDILREDPEIELSRGKSGNTIARLRTQAPTPIPGVRQTSTPSAYQIVILDALGGHDTVLRSTIESNIRDLKLDPARDIEFLGPNDLGRLRGASAKVGVLFSDGPAGQAFAMQVETLLNIPAVVIPVVRSLTNFSDKVPLSLAPTNGMALDPADTALERVAGLILELLGLMRRRRQLFISYKRTESAAVAQQFYHALDERSFDVFLDTFSVRPADPFQEQLWHRMADSDVVVLLYTASIQSSTWVQQEIERASGMKITVLQLIWPGVVRDPKTAFFEPLYLESTDFESGGQLRPERTADICALVESLRAGSLAARETELVGAIRDRAAKRGLTTALQPTRYVDVRLGSSGYIRVIPTVGVPDSESFQAGALAQVNGEGPKQVVLLYDSLSVASGWKKHLDWLDQHLPVKTVKAFEVDQWLGSLQI